MTLIGQDILVAVARRDPPLRGWLTVWAATVEQVAWRSIVDVRATYPTADGVTLGSGTVVTVFNVRGNRFRLLTWVDYESQLVEVLDVLTHAEYDRDLWKGRY